MSFADKDDCLGNGGCFGQDDSGNYIKFYECKHLCELIKCPGYNYCKQKLPLYLLNIHHGFCINCDVVLWSTYTNNKHYESETDSEFDEDEYLYGENEKK